MTDLQRQPPQIAVAVREGARHVDGEGQVVALEDRIGVDEVVAIAVVEGEAGEGTLEGALRQAEMGLVERDDVEARIERHLNGPLEELRRDPEDAVGLEGPLRLGRHVMQHEDGTDALGQAAR